MKLLVIIATVLVCSCAISTDEWDHLSPVNPDVLVAAKPKEKIILITDPKEIAKFKRETKLPLYPTVLPKHNEFYITKRDDISKTRTHLEASANAKNPPQYLQDFLKSSLGTRNRRNVESYQNPTKSTHSTGILSPEKIVQEVITSKNNGNEQISKQIHHEKIDEKHVALEVIHKPQGLPVSSSLSSLQQEVQIPVTVLKQFPKFIKSEESLKDSHTKESDEENDQKYKHSSPEVYQKTRELPSFLSPSKRDIPVHLIAKHHHPEESPKENTKQEFHEDHIKNIVTTEGLQKTQTLPLVAKEIAQDTDAQHKRDIPVPLVPKYHHPEESPKDIIQKDPLVSHVFKQENEYFSKVDTQPLSAISKQTGDFSQPETSISETSIPMIPIQKDKKDFKEKSENHYDSQTHHIPQSLAAQSHKDKVLSIYHDHLSQKDKNNKQRVEGLQKHQILPVNNQEQIVPAKAQKPPALSIYQEDLKVSASNKLTESANEQLHVSNVPVGDHHSENSQKKSNHNKEEVKKSTAEKQQQANQHYEKDLSFQTPIHNLTPIQQDNKPNVLNDHLSITDSSTSTTKHPIIRNRPVPVAELFARAHGN